MLYLTGFGSTGIPDTANAVTSRFPPPEVPHRIEVTGADVPGPRTVFASRTDLMPDTAYAVEGRGTFYTDSNGTVTHVETTYGNGPLNPDLMNSQPDTTYVVGNHTFEIDSQGRTAAVHIDDLRLSDAHRSDYTQSRIGNHGGPGYDGGHLAANVFGGGAENINMVAMLRELNLGPGNSYFNLETSGGHY